MSSILWDVSCAPASLCSCLNVRITTPIYEKNSQEKMQAENMVTSNLGLCSLPPLITYLSQPSELPIPPKLIVIITLI
jgi:hypothetical protein